MSSQDANSLKNDSSEFNESNANESFGKDGKLSVVPHPAALYKVSGSYASAKKDISTSTMSAGDNLNSILSPRRSQIPSVKF